MSTDRLSTYWYNGQLIVSNTVELAIADPGVLYGATVFTTLRVYGDLDHPLTQWAGHCDRLRTSLQTFGWPQPDWPRLRQGAQALMTQFAVLRIVIFADGREWITGRALPPDLAQRQQQGISAWLVAPPSPTADYGASPPVAQTWMRSLPLHKTSNYLVPWLALQQAQQRGAQEAILVDEAGNWLETSTGNLWGWGGGYWWTPPVAGILPGLSRNHLIQRLKCQNVKVEEAVWTPDLVQQLTAIAYSNCVVELIPIHTILSITSPPVKRFAIGSWRSLQRLFCP